jgi:hypothetical protein
VRIEEEGVAGEREDVDKFNNSNANYDHKQILNGQR